TSLTSTPSASSARVRYGTDGSAAAIPICAEALRTSRRVGMDRPPDRECHGAPRIPLIVRGRQYTGPRNARFQKNWTDRVTNAQQQQHQGDRLNDVRQSVVVAIDRIDADPHELDKGRRERGHRADSAHQQEAVPVAPDTAAKTGQQQERCWNINREGHPELLRDDKDHDAVESNLRSGRESQPPYGTTGGKNAGAENPGRKRRQADQLKRQLPEKPTLRRLLVRAKAVDRAACGGR